MIDPLFNSYNFLRLTFDRPSSIETSSLMFLNKFLSYAWDSDMFCGSEKLTFATETPWLDDWFSSNKLSSISNDSSVSKYVFYSAFVVCEIGSSESK